VQERSDYVHHASESIIIAGGSTLLALIIAIPPPGDAFAPTKRTKDVLLWCSRQDDAVSRRAGPNLSDLPEFRLLDSRQGWS